MISREPMIRVGVVDHTHRVSGECHGGWTVGDKTFTGGFVVADDGGTLCFSGPGGEGVSRGARISCGGSEGSSVTLHDVTIGSTFHWERRESQTFRGDLMFVRRADGSMAAIVLVRLEEYLVSVISSEMNPDAPPEFLKAHAITSRSWLGAMLGREHKSIGITSMRSAEKEGQLLRWYEREDHDLYDVCADDHCQRFQGTAKSPGTAARHAVRATAGGFLVHGGEICDARFSKACGGMTELYENCWEGIPVPYLQSVMDSDHTCQGPDDEQHAESWIRSRPDVFCNVSDADLMGRILPSFDRETKDFFRWKQEYRREELEEVLHAKSGLDFGKVLDLVPVERGPSGRIVRLKIRGTRNTLVVGKELEIRRWLSSSHLYSSAFVIEKTRDASGNPVQFTLHGCGWGHGVGLCQIGAAVMASRGKTAPEILRHYYRGADLHTLYSSP